MTDTTKTLYEAHHAALRAPDFSILKDERGQWMRSAVGTGKRVLDLGCRDGALTALYMEGNSVLGADVDDVALSRARERGIDTRHVDLMGDWSELSGERFDAIVAGEFLEHVFYPERIVDKVAAHLKEGGVFAGSVPNAFSLRNRLRYLAGSRRHTPLEDPTHITQFSAAELTALLRRAFGEVQVSGLGNLGFLARRAPDLFAFDLVFLAKKT